MLITNGRVLTFGDRPRLIETGAVLIEGDLIAAVGEAAVLEAEHPATKRLDAKGMLMMPGMICAHTHFYGAFARGMYIPGPPMRDFPEILARLWWPLDRALDAEGVRYSALGPLIDAIRFGTTTLIDHHASNRFIAGSLDVIAEAVEEAGLRACLCYEVSDRDGPEVAQAGIRENVRFIEKTRRQANPRLAATFGLHAALTLSDATLADCLAAAARLGEVGFHIHAAEGTADREHSLATYGLRTLDRLAQAGILGPRTIVAHAIDIDAWEMALLRETGTWVSHQPRSNMNNGVGLPAVESMLRAGVRVCLGNDGFSNTMWQEWKAAYLAHKLINLDPRRMSATDIVQMAIANNAALVERLLPGAPVGVLQPGTRADLIFVDYQPYTPLSPGNLPWHIVFGFHESMVTTTIINGKVLMRDRQLLTLDEAKIAAEARRLAPQVWERYNQKIVSQ